MAKNCIITGCGRSGTSMLAGSISAFGYNIGGKGYAGNKGNPKGYFETSEVNNINDTILFADERSRFTKGGRHGWLTRFPVEECPDQLPDTKTRIINVIASEPFCLKDPRFSYTLPIWREYLPNAVYVCVFRHPGTVVNSMMTNCNSAPYLSRISIDRNICYDIWYHMYSHLLRHATNDWIFLHYNQILNGEGLDIIEECLETRVDKHFPTSTLCRSDEAQDVPKEIVKIYSTLCLMAGHMTGE